MTPAYLSPKAVAELTGLSEKTIRRAYESGELQAFKPGGRVLILAADVNAWIEAHRIIPGGPNPTPIRRVKPASGGLRELLGEGRSGVRGLDTAA